MQPSTHRKRIAGIVLFLLMALAAVTFTESTNHSSAAGTLGLGVHAAQAAPADNCDNIGPPPDITGAHQECIPTPTATPTGN